MADFLYTIIIFPVVQLIGLAHIFALKLFQNESAAILAVSFTVSVCTLPLYLMAEKLQQAERDIQKRLKPKIERVKSAFSGDERYMMLSNYYRLEHYHPVYALRGTLGLLIQIPFFIAAYSYLSHLESLRWASFLFIDDLSRPDSIVFAGIHLNILPLIMTIINCASGVLYTKELSVRDKVQAYGTALIFLILLYNSPAGLVLYWTANNIFSLLKHILQKIKKARPLIFSASCIAVCVVDLYILFIRQGSYQKRIFAALIFSLVFFIPLINKLCKTIKKIAGRHIKISTTALYHDKTYIISAFLLFLLSGLVIPASLIASSVEEFSLIGTLQSPFPFLYNTVFQAAGIFLFWAAGIYFLFSKPVKVFLNFILSLLAVIALAQKYIFQANYGPLNILLRFSNAVYSSFSSDLLNIIILAALIAVFSFLLLSKRRIIFYTFQIILLIALLISGIINIITIQSDYQRLVKNGNEADGEGAAEPIYSFSKTGENIVVIMLDRAISAYVPYIFEEKPELSEAFSGFTWYPNTISFGEHTNFGVPGIFGGYRYTPLAMQKNTGETLAKKYNEALLLMPEIFLLSNWDVTVSNLPYADYNVWETLVKRDNPAFHIENTASRWTTQWLRTYTEPILASQEALIKRNIENNLLRFSFFIFSPYCLRNIVYDEGYWLNAGRIDITDIDTLDNYAELDMLGEISSSGEDNKNSFIIIDNELPHSPAFLKIPEYKPAMNVSDRGNGPFANEDSYHVNTASLLLLAKWFDFLKDNQVYDNTRIIIVSDHGANIKIDFPGNITLPNDEYLAAYNALLLVKDFNVQGTLKRDDTFMTNADVPLIAMAGIIDKPLNPWTGEPLRPDKANGVTITTSHLWDFAKHPIYTYRIKKDQWLRVKENIFQPQNWVNVEITE